MSRFIRRTIPPLYVHVGAINSQFLSSRTTSNNHLVLFQLVGFLTTLIVWDHILQNAFSSEVNGIDCVIETDQGQVFTYTVVNGVPHPM